MTPGEFPFWVVGTVLSETALPDPEQSYAIALLARGRGGSEVEINGAVGWFVWFRPYAPTEAVFDQTRSLSDFEKTDSRSRGRALQRTTATQSTGVCRNPKPGAS